jgi:two-component system, cell cycle sensor histidine kinase and response regulator CckA
MNEDALRVLIVDRETRCIAAITSALHQIDGATYRIDSRPTCLDAARAFRDCACDVALVDHRALDPASRPAVLGDPTIPPIIVLTADAGLGRTAMLEGAADWLPREGVSPELLTRSIRYAIDRRRMAACLQRTEQRREAILETAIDSIISIDLAGRIMDFNPAAERTFGWRRADILGRMMVETIVPESLRSAHRAGFSRHVAEGTSKLLGQRIETTAVRRDGIEFPIELTIVRIDAAGETRFTAHIRDITDRKNAERALLRSEAQYREFVEHATFGIYRSTMEGRFVSANSTLVEMLGYESEAELLDLDISRDVYAVPRQRADILARHFQEHEGRDVEVVWKRKDGRRLTVRLTGRPVFSDGVLTHFDMFVEDITERRSLHEQLLRSQKIETVGRLAGGIAHDFNNLLTGILGYSQLLLEQFTGEDPRRRDLEEIHKAGLRAAQLTRQLLAFSRKQVLKATSIDLNASLTALSSLMHRLIGEHIEIALVLDPEAWPVLADPGQIEQVVLNLAVNARDAMPDGGTLTISTKNVHLDDEFARVHIGAQAGSYVSLGITDTGAGMTADVMAHIFEPFFTTKGPDKGTGLGLATVYGIVKQSGGSIWVDSDLKRGTTVTVYLPRSNAPPSNVVGTQRPSAVMKGVGETILLVEDDPGVRALAMNVLTRLGYQVLSASSGDEALTLAQQASVPIHLLLTDVVMPNMSGRDVAAHLKQLRPDVRVLFMSGYTEEALGTLKDGAELLHKPFTIEGLSGAVRRALEQRG